MRESLIESYLVDQVKRRNGICWKWVSPSRNGVPDRIVIIDGRVFFVEVKATGKIPTSQQLHVHGLMAAAGAEVFTVDSKEAIDALF